MPLAEFDKQAMLLQNGRVRVTGTVELEQEAAGTEVPRRGPVHFNFLIVKDGLVVRGEAQTTGGNWSGTTGAAPGLQPGTAQAGGLAVLAREGPPPAFETFSWFEQIELVTTLTAS
jgi:hypothetical protein